MISRAYQLPEKDFIQIIANSTSCSDALRKMGYRSVQGNARDVVNRRIKELNLDTSHWKPYSTKEANQKSSISLEEYFQANTPRSGKNLRNKLLKNHLLEYKCAICGNEGYWNGQPITLQVDHINGNHDDNRLENLRFLCPNCHSQTTTFAGRNCEHATPKSPFDIKIFQQELKEQEEKMKKQEQDFSIENKEDNRKTDVKEVNQYDLQGNYIATFKSSYEAAKQFGSSMYGSSHIRESCDNPNRTYLNYMWRYVTDEAPIGVNITAYKYTTLSQKTTLQYDMNGVLLNEYPSAAEAARQNGWNAKNIQRACRGDRTTAYGYVWKYKDQ